MFLLTGEDTFNALAAALLRGEGGPEVYLLPEREENRGLVAPVTAGESRFGPAPSRHTLAERHRAGARIEVHPAGTAAAPGHDLLFTVDGAGRLRPATIGSIPEVPAGGCAITVGPADRHT